MFMTSMVISVIFTVITLALTLITISKGYSFKHTVDPIEKDGEVREYTGNGKRL